jgi:hypothetical protein
LRKALTPQEIIELEQALIETFALLRAFQRRVPIARHIKFPQIPAILTESFVIAAAGRLFGTDWRASFGGSLSDVQLLSSSGQAQRVAVKATARHGFQELKAKDLLADTLIWIHFGDRFYEGHGVIQIMILDNPGKYILAPVRLDIPRLMNKVGDTSDLRRIEVADLKDFLVGNKLQ